MKPGRSSSDVVLVPRLEADGQAVLNGGAAPLAGEKPAPLADPRTQAGYAARALLASYLGAIENAEPGVRAGDPERLHDLRVGCRRTRAVLDELGDLLDPEIRDRASRGFAWLGAKAGPVRDLDVLLQKLRAEPDQALEPLVAHAERRRREALRTLRRALASKRRRRLFRAWHAYLASGGEPECEDAERPIEEVARERLAALSERFLDRGRRLSRKAKPRRVHKLRIQAKTLRYLVEDLGGVLSPVARAAVVRRLKKLQDALGKFNDAVVETRLLERYAAEMTAAGAASGKTLRAIDRRRADARRRKKRLRRRARRRFERFAERAPLEELFARTAQVAEQIG